MGNCLKAEEDEEVIDLSEGPVKNRKFTDVIWIPIFIAAQVIYIIVTIAGMADGDPAKLYEPRDFMGAYCGVEENWNEGPNTLNMPKLSYTMNLSSAVDEVMRQTICSPVAKRALVDGDGSIQPLLQTTQEQQDYLCSCCLVPCDKCVGGSDNGGVLADTSSLSDTISSRMSELTDMSKAGDLFNPLGANGDMFSTNDFWGEANKYFNMVCLPDCATDYQHLNTSRTAGREYKYTPPQDSGLHQVWTTLADADGNYLTNTIKATMDTAFTFEALPFSVCPYSAQFCVPFPGMTFKELAAGSDYCSFEMASQVVAEVGQAAAAAFQSIGLTSLSAEHTENFGELVGDFERSLDTFAIVAVLTFIIGVVVLVALRFTISICVWISVFIVTFSFFFGAACAYVRSGQCAGADFFGSGAQTVSAITVSGTQAISNAASNTEAASEDYEAADASDYRGVQHRTKSGLSCLEWDTQTVMPEYNSTNYPDSGLLKNYCRNPSKDTDLYTARTIWCITGDVAVPWEECAPIGVFQPECANGYAVTDKNMRDVLWYSSFVIWGLGIIWFVLVVCMVGRIRLAIAINKVAASFVTHNPHIVLVPIVQVIFAILWTALWVHSAAFLLSQVPDSHTPMEKFETYAEAAGTGSECAFWEFGSDCTASPGKCTDSWPTGSVWKDNVCDMVNGTALCWRCAPPRYMFDWRFAVSFFVFLWNNAFNVALGQLIVAMTVAIWFFQPPSVKGSVLLLPNALRQTFKYHIGSVMFGSFIVALVEFIRYVMKYFEEQAKAQKNRVLALLLKGVQCCIWCFEKCIKFLNKNAYIQIALTSKSFCPAARAAFMLILRNALRFGTLGMLGFAIQLIGYLCIMGSSLVCGYFLIREMHPDIQPVLPMVIYGALSYIVAKLYMNVFGLAVDTSLQCFLVVEENPNMPQDTVPEALQDFVANHPPASQKASDAAPAPEEQS